MEEASPQNGRREFHNRETSVITSWRSLRWSSWFVPIHPRRHQVGDAWCRTRTRDCRPQGGNNCCTQHQRMLLIDILPHYGIESIFATNCLQTGDTEYLILTAIPYIPYWPYTTLCPTVTRTGSWTHDVDQLNCWLSNRDCVKSCYFWISSSLHMGSGLEYLLPH